MSGAFSLLAALAVTAAPWVSVGSEHHYFLILYKVEKIN